jgi:hypothetical protein
MRRGRDSNPRYAFGVRQFSKLLVSATHPPLQRVDKGKKRIVLAQFQSIYNSLRGNDYFLRVSTAIFIAVTAASSPLLPCFPPLLSSAC